MNIEFVEGYIIFSLCCFVRMHANLTVCNQNVNIVKIRVTRQGQNIIQLIKSILNYIVTVSDQFLDFCRGISYIIIILTQYYLFKHG